MDVVEGYRRYYVIEYLAKRLTTHVPVPQWEALNFRTVMSRDKARQVLAIMAQAPRQLPDHYKKRRRELEAAVESGYPLKLAETIRDLTWRKHNNKLNTSERTMLTESRKRVIMEIALVTDQTKKEVRRKVDAALRQALASEPVLSDPIPA